MTNTRNSANLAISSPKPVEVSEIHSAYQAASVRDPFGSLMQQQSVLISKQTDQSLQKTRGSLAVGVVSRGEQHWVLTRNLIGHLSLVPAQYHFTEHCRHPANLPPTLRQGRRLLLCMAEDS